VVTEQASDGWAKAGVMIRESLSAASANVSLLVSYTNGLAFQQRAATGGATTYLGAGGSAPRWVRLARTSAQITAAASIDGVTWTTIGTAAVSMASNIYAGLAVSSRQMYSLAQATFDNISVTGSLMLSNVAWASE